VGVGKFEFVAPSLGAAAETLEAAEDDGTGDGVTIGANGERVCFENTDGGGRFDARGVSAGGRAAGVAAAAAAAAAAMETLVISSLAAAPLLVACANNSFSGETLIDLVFVWS
jgi:hypothetical protein